MKIGFIGTGKVGQTLAQLWFLAGYTVSAIYNRSAINAQDLVQKVDSISTDSIEQVVSLSDIVFLTVPDDTIGVVAYELAEADWQGKAVVHTSGAKNTNPLAVLKGKGAMIGSLHPAFPFADVQTSIEQLPGASFAIEASDNLLQSWLIELVKVLDGEVMIIPEGGKGTYHAALVIACNYLVTLYGTAQDMLLEMGVPDRAVKNALDVLVGATALNLEKTRIPDALTGPLVRNDVSTIEAHLASLSDKNIRQAYRQLARLTYPILEARELPTKDIEQTLQQDEANATNNT